jgi:nitrite reductase (NADH) large subunit
MGTTAAAAAYQFTDERKQVYKKIVVSDCGKYLLGACWSATPPNTARCCR